MTANEVMALISVLTFMTVMFYIAKSTTTDWTK